MSSPFQDFQYRQFKEKIISKNIGAQECRELALIFIHELKPFYEGILSVKGMESFEPLKSVDDYLEQNLEKLDHSVLEGYINLCNETGAIVGEADETSLFSEEEIIDMANQYYEAVKELPKKEQVATDYAFSIMGSLYYLIRFFQKDDAQNDNILSNTIELFDYLIEEMLIDFNEEYFELTGISVLDNIVKKMNERGKIGLIRLYSRN